MRYRLTALSGILAVVAATVVAQQPEPKRSVEVEIAVANAQPRLKIEPGQMGTVRLRDVAWGLVPTVNEADPATVHIRIYDIRAEPRQQAADVDATVGGAAVSSETDPPFTVRIIAIRGTK